MASKSEGATVIANLEGKILRNRVVNVVKALPLSNKSVIAIPDIRNNKIGRIEEEKENIK